MFNLPLLAFAGSAFFALTVVIIHLVRKDLPFASTVLSRYATGSYGRLLVAGIFSIGFAEIFLSIGLAESAGLRLGNVLLMLAGISTVVVAAFKIELPKKTFRGYVHDFGAGMQFLFFPFALLQLEGVFLNGPLYVFTETVALCNLFLLLPITYFYFKETTFQEKYFGAIQKTNILLMNVWVMVIAFRFI